MNFLYIHGNFHQLYELPLYLPSISVNFLCLRQTFCQFPSTFSATAGTSVDFCQLTLPSPFSILLVVHETFRQHPSTFCAFAGNSINFMCFRCTFLQYLSTFCASARPSVCFRRLSVQPREPLSTSVNFPCICGTFCQIPSTIHASTRPSVNFLFVCWTFRHLSMYLRLLQSTLRASAGPPSSSINFRAPADHFVNFLCFQGPSVQFCQHSVPPRNHPLISVKFLYLCRIFCLLPSTF